MGVGPIYLDDDDDDDDTIYFLAQSCIGFYNATQFMDVDSGASLKSKDG